MTKRYRKRFVLITMALLGTVLLIGFLFLFIFIRTNNYYSLKNTMQQVVEPWNDPKEDAPPKKPDGEQKNNGANPPDRLDEEAERDVVLQDEPVKSKTGTVTEASGDIRRQEQRRIGDYSIVTVFYNIPEDRITLLTENDEIDEATLREIIPKILSSEKQFSVLKENHLIYYVDQDGDTCRIALTTASTLAANNMTTLAVLVLVYLASMAILLPVCIRLSAGAAKPMETAIEMERQFVANISHDLKTPITVILANNSILKSNPEFKTSEQSQWLDSTDDAAKNMMTMVEEMLELSSLEEQTQAVELVNVRLSSVAEKCVLQMEGLAYDRGISIEARIQPDIYVRATKEHAERICTSLLENALKYEPDGGEVYVTLSREKKKAVLTVRNPGSVISEEDLPHIFERFYRADKTRDIRQGHGLGLPIVKQIAELIGATIDAKSEADSGTVFTVAFETAENV